MSLEGKSEGRGESMATWHPHKTISTSQHAQVELIGRVAPPHPRNEEMLSADREYFQSIARVIGMDMAVHLLADHISEMEEAAVKDESLDQGVPIFRATRLK